MLSFINIFNLIIFLLFSIMYLYQIAYVFVSFFGKKPKFEADTHHKYAVIIAARNERDVICQLIESIKKQKYPQDMLDIFVVADNCTDDTAQLARQAGACVFERQSDTLIGKGYALNFAFENILPKNAGYEGYFVFDADNLLEENYIAEMNKVFHAGYRIVTSYRNSKNYDTNWISAGSSLWFLKEARFLNNARMILGTSCAVSGTGFLVHSDIIEKNCGWKHHLLTEDIEFSIDNVIKGEIIGYCDGAMLYDEQPISFDQSWKQRLRWAKGFYQVAKNYGLKLIKGVFGHHSISCYDMLMTVCPAMALSVIGVIVNAVVLVLGLNDFHTAPQLVYTAARSIALTVGNFYLLLYAFGFITTITEWKKIHTTSKKKILYTFTFPIFMFTYVPISIVALFKKIEWTPIRHSISKSIEEIKR